MIEFQKATATYSKDIGIFDIDAALPYTAADANPADLQHIDRRVVAAFSAWNFPILLPARKVAASIAAGCSVILKPPILCGLGFGHFYDLFFSHSFFFYLIWLKNSFF